MPHSIHYSTPLFSATTLSHARRETYFATDTDHHYTIFFLHFVCVVCVVPFIHSSQASSILLAVVPPQTLHTTCRPQSIFFISLKSSFLFSTHQLIFVCCIIINITVKPLKVEIVTPNEILSTGRVAFIKCETWGSHPAAKVIWLLDGETIRQADIATTSDASPVSASNVTTSMLSFKVLPEFDGRELTCKAMNPWFLNGAIEDNRRISVSCK